MNDDPFARRYPHLAPLADELEQILTVIQACNDGYGDIKLSFQGLKNKKLQIKYIDTQLRYFLKSSNVS